MTTPEINHLRFDLFASVKGNRATSVEIASWRRIRWAGYIPLEDNWRPFIFRVHTRSG
jgi:hypothetical protein